MSEYRDLDGTAYWTVADAIAWRTGRCVSSIGSAAMFGEMEGSSDLVAAATQIIRALRSGELSAIRRNCDFVDIAISPSFWADKTVRDDPAYWDRDIRIEANLVRRLFGIIGESDGRTSLEIARAPSVKEGRPPDDYAILAKADEMKCRGLDGRTIAKTMRFEPGFANVATIEVRRLIKGRWPRGRPKKPA